MEEEGSDGEEYPETQQNQEDMEDEGIEITEVAILLGYYHFRNSCIGLSSSKP